MFGNLKTIIKALIIVTQTNIKINLLNVVKDDLRLTRAGNQAVRLVVLFFEFSERLLKIDLIAFGKLTS